MKKMVMLSMVFCFISGWYPMNSKAEPGDNTQSTIEIMCCPALEDLAHDWVKAYQAENPDAKMTVVEMSADQKNPEGKIVLLTGDEYNDAIADAQWKMLIGRDVIVPVISSDNSHKELICTHGISPKQFSGACANADQITWNQVVSGAESTPLNIYFTSNTCRQKVASFMKVSEESLNENNLIQEEEVARVLDENPNAVVFCKLNTILDKEKYTFYDGMELLPMDRNDNGKIDYFEDIYSTPNNFTRAVWIGKYPAGLRSNIYLIATEPNQESELAFYEWALTKGQEHLAINGFSNLVNRESQAQLAQLQPSVQTVETEASGSFLPIVWIVIGSVILLAIIVLYLATRSRKRKSEDAESFIYSPTIDAATIDIPKGLFFDRTHTWAFREKNGQVRVGIDDFLQHITGPLTNVALKKPGENIKKGEAFLTLAQDGKQLTVYAPISGVITKQNETLNQDAEKINTSPFYEGWVYLIEPANWSRDMGFMKMADNYKSWIKEEFARLKDFIATHLKTNELNGAIAYQDGGTVKDGWMSNMNPSVWEDFQMHFINKSK